VLKADLFWLLCGQAVSMDAFLINLKANLLFEKRGGLFFVIVISHGDEIGIILYQSVSVTVKPPFILIDV
jgi:hypothetical protein